MKKLLILLAVVLLPCASYGEAAITTFGQFNFMVRQMTKIKSTQTLPESTLVDISQQSILWTSVDAGGVEQELAIPTIVDSQFYDLPDTLVEVLFASITLTKAKKVVSIKAWYPQFFDETGLSAGYEGLETNDDEVPFGYNYWANRLQLLPVPIQIDTVRLKCYVEHRLLTDDTMTLSFTYPVFVDVALFQACYRAFLVIQEYNKAATYLGIYERQKQMARAKYARKWDLTGGGQ